jgi:hypothetical protein
MCPQPQKDYHSDMVPAAYARDASEAEYYRSLLENFEIPVEVAEEKLSSKPGDKDHGVPVLVPEEHLAEAQDIIEQRLALDEEFDVDSDDYDDDDDLDEFDLVDDSLLDRKKVDDLDDEDFVL